MIKDPPIFKIRRSFPRPPEGIVLQLTGAMTGHLVDAMSGGGALDGRIKPLGGRSQPFCGVAVTCHAGPADNLAMFGALDVLHPGDIIVMVAREGHLAGAVRDVAGIIDVGLPVYCAGVSPNSSARNGPGSVGLPVIVGGLAVSSGDIGDGDGVVVVPRAAAADVIARLAEVRAAEAALDAKVKAGLRIPEFVAALLNSDRIEHLA